MNSADKINDDNIVVAHGLLPVPTGGFLNQSRTVVMQDGTSTWFDSPAADESPASGGLMPLDLQMGTGELDAKRVLTQFSAGEFRSIQNNGPARVPVIGWDYGHSTNGQTNTYALNQQLPAGSFVSITLAWDRLVQFAPGSGAGGEYHAGDSFVPSTDSQIPGNDQISALELSLRDTTTGNTIAESVATGVTVQHIFWQIPMNDQYEFQVKQVNNNADAVDYGVAWWAFGTGKIISDLGDINQDGFVNIADISSLMSALSDLSGYKSTHQFTNSQDLIDVADVNQDGSVNNLDIQSLICMVANNVAGGGAVTPVPEPTSLYLMAFIVIALLVAKNKAAKTGAGYARG